MKQSIHTVPFHVGDFITDTMHLSPSEVGAYMRLLMYHYKVGTRGLPCDDIQLRRITGLDNKTWKNSRDNILSFFDLTQEQKYVCGRVLDAIDLMRTKSEQNRGKSLKRWNTDDAAALPEESHGNATGMQSIIHNPETSKKPSLNPPLRKAVRLPDDWTLPQEWGEWAEGEGLEGNEILKEAVKMLDWTKSNGVTKKDWEATWRNWIRKHMEDKR